MPRRTYYLCGSRVCGTDFGDDDRWFSLDCTGLICGFLSLFFHFFTYITFQSSFLHPYMWGSIDKHFASDGSVIPTSPTPTQQFFRYTWLSITTVFFLLSITSHLRCMFTNPGTIPPNAKPLPPELQQKCTHLTNFLPARARLEASLTLHNRQCSKCSLPKPPRTHHSSVSGRCITKLDHFCPWVNNEVGVWNHKFFILFVSYTCLQCVFALIICVRTYYVCGAMIRQSDPSMSSSNSTSSAFDDDDGTLFAPPSFCQVKIGTAAHMVTGLSVVFLLFTSCMAIDQIEGVTKGRNKIQRLQEKRERGREAKVEVGDVEGGDGNSINEDEEDNIDWIGCNEVFGGFGRGVRWDWFLPTRVEFHGISRALILGYVEEGEDATGDGDVEMKDIKEEENEGLLVKRQNSSQTSSNQI